MRQRSASSLFVLFLVMAAPLAAQDYTYSGVITSGAQYDLYTVPLRGSDLVVATLVCDFDGVSRPLDPVLSVFYPGSDPSDTSNADQYNDDGFGGDDDPNGVDCDAFDSSRVIFTAPIDGDYVFRADGFGSSTGPYTLSIYITTSPLAIPTVDAVGMSSLVLLLFVAGVYTLRRRRRA
ncbi:MAG: hypothetical protein AB7G12_10900 [Thermoanaerobaculia bacterium]